MHFFFIYLFPFFSVSASTVYSVPAREWWPYFILKHFVTFHFEPYLNSALTLDSDSGQIK